MIILAYSRTSLIISCFERQWALIHLEQVWAENVRTVEGKHLHNRVDDPFKDESRTTLRIVRGMPVVSQQLGLRGVADVVEFHAGKEHIEGEYCRLENRGGWWRPVPVEYKRGRPKRDDRDAVQLCAQAIALEEMLQVHIPSGFLFLDTQVGFLHRDRPGRPSLALDIMEEMRPHFADRLAVTLINRNQITADGFNVKENGAVIMEDSTRKEVLNAWQKRKQEELTHPYLGEKIPMGLVPYVQALLLARHMRGDLEDYPPFFWK